MAQFPNSGFESWSVDTAGVPLLSGWRTNNGTSQHISVSPDSLSPFNGKFAMRLRNNSQFGFEVGEGYAMTNVVDSSGVYDTAFIMVSIPDTISSFFKLYVKVRSHGYQPADSSLHFFSQSHTNGYERWSVPFNFSQVPDSVSVWIGLICSCSSPITKRVLVDGVHLRNELSSSEFFLNWNLHFYPNPTTGRITLNRQRNIPISMDILDLSGNLIHQQPVESGEIQLPSIAKGIYLVVWKGEAGEVQVDKIVIL